MIKRLSVHAWHNNNKSLVIISDINLLEYQSGDLVMIKNYESTPGTSKKLIPQFRGPYGVKRKLPNDRYLVSDPPGFQNTQKLYTGVWEASKMRPWIKANPISPS